MAEGIEVRHQKRCRKHADAKARCSCDPSFRAIAQYRGNRAAKTFATERDAKRWRADKVAFWRTHDGRGGDEQVVVAMVALLAGMEDESVRNRSGDVYKPSVIRSYRTSFERHIRRRAGNITISDLQRSAVQEWVRAMLGEGLDPATIRNALLPLRVLYREALMSDAVESSPLDHISLPAIRGRRSRAVTPQQARDLLDALPMPDKAIWATAMYAGLRRGELRALRSVEVDLDARVLRVKNGWDDVAGEIPAKHRQEEDDERLVPIVGPLKSILVEHAAWRLLNPIVSERLFCGPKGGPFTSRYVAKCADAAWAKAKLERLTLHEARHCCASLLGAARIPANIVALVLGHEDVRVTARYTHALPDWVGGLLEQADAFLAPTA